MLVSYTRRTPARARDVMTPILSTLPGIVWDGNGDNPYFAFLAAADAILITEESTNLATDAAATGAPVFVLPMAGRSPKLQSFHRDLASRGLARPFVGNLTAARQPSLRQ